MPIEIENNPLVMTARLIVFFLCTFGNTFVVLFILRSKTLRRENFNILLVQLSISDIFLGIGNGMRGVQFLIIDSSQAQTNIECALIGIPIVIGSYLSEINMFLIAVDRLACVMAPVFFRFHMTQKVFAVGRFTFAQLLAMFLVGLQFVGMDGNQHPPVCNALYTWQPAYKDFYLYGTSCIDIVSLCSYGVILLVFRQNKKETTGKQRQFYCVVFFVVVAFIIFWMIPKLTFLAHLLLQSKSVAMQISAVLVGYLEGVNGIANVCIFVATNQEARRLVLRRKTVTTAVEKSRQQTFTVDPYVFRMHLNDSSARHMFRSLSSTPATRHRSFSPSASPPRPSASLPLSVPETFAGPTLPPATTLRFPTKEKETPLAVKVAFGVRLGSYDEAVRHFAKNPLIRATFLEVEDKSAGCLAFNCDGSILACNNAKHNSISIGQLDYSSNLIKQFRDAKGHESLVPSIDFHPENKYRFVSCGTGDRMVCVWDVREKEVATRIYLNNDSKLWRSKWTPSGQQILVADQFDSLTLIDPRKPIPLKVGDMMGDCRDICIEPGGKYVFTGAHKGRVDVYSIAELKHMTTIKAHPDHSYCSSIAITSDGSTMAVGSSDSICSLWKLDQFMCTRTIGRLDYNVTSVAFSHCDNLLAIGAEDHFIDIAYQKTAERVAEVQLAGGCPALAWHPSAYLLAYSTESDLKAMPVRIYGYGRIDEDEA
ncbi:hypothetical protein QR680_018829 [Steinernema hermaphroditum]|uniref:G-protein coupled receptors family 1 profile domain-containing protein n=1 Tax=Steinernema hermaphroditum TaxID=289476 RepID=A0AA39HJ49_9BILA|nr:hypothetical protein QR680_018829 [Steinernema hermaphroditum]